MSKSIYIVQMHTGTLPSRFVKLMTGYPYSHVALSLTADCDTVYSFGRKSLHAFWNGGFVAEKKDGRFFQKFKNTTCRVRELVVTEQQYDALQTLLLDMQQNTDLYRYDFFGTALRFFHIPITFKNRYVCSQFVAEALTRCHIATFQKRLCMVKPADFDKLEAAHEIFCGNFVGGISQ